jgi:MFS family permease
LIGDYFFSATIMLWVIDRLARGETWLPLATGGVAMAATLPTLLLAPFAGVFVDRWEKHWTMIWTDTLRLLLVSLFVLMTLLVSERGLLLVSALVMLVLLGLFSSSIFVTVRPLTVLVTPRELIGRVMAFEVPLITVASLLGGLLASLLASTVLAGFHAQVAGMTFGRLDALFVGVGLLTISAGVFARLTLYRAVRALRAQTVAGA